MGFKKSRSFVEISILTKEHSSLFSSTSGGLRQLMFSSVHAVSGLGSVVTCDVITMSYAAPVLLPSIYSSIFYSSRDFKMMCYNDTSFCFCSRALKAGKGHES